MTKTERLRVWLYRVVLDRTPPAGSVGGGPAVEWIGLGPTYERVNRSRGRRPTIGGPPKERR